MLPRIQKVIKLLKSEKCDAVLVVNSEGGGQPGTQYISGFSGSSSIILITKSKRILITDNRYTEQARTEAKGFEVIILKFNQTVSEILKNLCRKFKLNKILIDGTKTYYTSVENIKKSIPDIEIISKNHTLQEIRIIKDAKEIALLKKSAEMASKAFLKFLPEIKVGVSEKFLAKKMNTLCREMGADEMAFDTIIASGKHGTLPHARPTDKKIRKGELIVIDWGVKYKGYVSDTTRTVAMGKTSPRLQKMYEAVKEAQEAGCKSARAGVPARAVDSACRQILKKHNLEKYFTHATGHGIGMEIHELPIIAPKRDSLLQVGMVITCEPGAYIPGVSGIRIEDSLIVTKFGNINLTETLTKNLIVL